MGFGGAGLASQYSTIGRWAGVARPSSDGVPLDRWQESDGVVGRVVFSFLPIIINLMFLCGLVFFATLQLPYILCVCVIAQTRQMSTIFGEY